MPTIDLDMAQVDALRDILGCEGDGLPECLMPLDRRLGELLGCDRYAMYQDALHRYRFELIRTDGRLDLNLAESILVRVGFDGPDLNLAERVLSEWRESRAMFEPRDEEDV